MNLTNLWIKMLFLNCVPQSYGGCWHEVRKFSGLFPGLLGWLSCSIEVFVFELWFGQQSILGSKRFGLKIWYCSWKFFVLDFMEWSLWTKRLVEYDFVWFYKYTVMEMWSDCLIIMGYLHMKYELAFSFPLCTIWKGLACILKETKCAVVTFS